MNEMFLQRFGLALLVTSGLMTMAARPVHADPPQTRWRQRPRVTDTFTDREAIMFYVVEGHDADLNDDGRRPTLGVACLNDVFGFLIDVGDILAVSPDRRRGQRTLQVRFDDAPPEPLAFYENANSAPKGHLSPIYEQEFAVRLFNASRFRVEAFLYQGGRTVLDFDVAGFKDVLPKVAIPCGLAGAPK